MKVLAIKDDKVILFSNNRRDLDDIQFNLNSKPHDYTITKFADGFIMTISDKDMSRILQHFACL